MSNRWIQVRPDKMPGPEQGPNYLQRLSADATSKQRVKVDVVFRKVN